VAAFEILLGTPAVCNIIREGKTHQLPSAIQTGKGLGMTTMTDSLFGLVHRGIVEPAEAFKKAVDKEALASKLAAAGIRLDVETPAAGSPFEIAAPRSTPKPARISA
jgi:twitching motility protein PilT